MRIRINKETPQKTTTSPDTNALTADPQLLNIAADATPKYPTLRAHEGQMFP
jgi:hypothetical protein